jgi:ferrous-iron efflux pump FieF
MSIPNPHFGGGISPADARIRKQAVAASLLVGGALASLKLYAWTATGAVSMLSSLFDSCFDVIASLIAMAGVVHAAAPPDAQHRFGHGKAEALAAFIQSLLIAVSGLFLLREAGARVIHPVAIDDPVPGFAVSAAAIVLTGLLVAFQRRAIARTGSMAVNADSLHYRGDLLMNLGVIAALAIAAYTPFAAADAFFAAAIALYLLRGAFAIGRQAVDVLMDRELENARRAEILAAIARHPQAVAVHDLRTRSTGERIFIEFHLEMDGALTLAAAHAVTEEIERILYDAFPHSEVIIHQEPAGLDDHRLDDRVRR